jgi:hypothetical protein
MSKIGLAAKPGAEVLPICSIRSTQVPRWAMRTSRSSAKAWGQREVLFDDLEKHRRCDAARKRDMPGPDVARCGHGPVSGDDILASRKRK